MPEVEGVYNEIMVVSTPKYTYTWQTICKPDQREYSCKLF